MSGATPYAPRMATPRAPKAKTDRLELRIAPTDRALLQRAADREGLGLADFVRRAALVSARAALAKKIDSPTNETA